jgi:tellurite resistance protein TehA-like permease
LSITPGPSIKDSPSLWTLVVLVSIWLLVYGFMEITLAFRLRTVHQTATRIAAAT